MYENFGKNWVTETETHDGENAATIFTLVFTFKTTNLKIYCFVVYEFMEIMGKTEQKYE